MEWVNIVSEYGSWVFILIVVWLFTQGKIFSRKTVEKIEKSYEANLTALRESFEKNIDNMCKNHAKEVKMITMSFNKSLAQLKEMIRIFKQKNGIKV